MSIKSRIDRLTGRILRYIHRQDYLDRRRQRPMEIVWEASAEESAKFISENLENAILCETRDDLWRHALKSIPSSGKLMECGVFEGLSINFIGDWMKTNNDQRIIDGFDSFEGLEEDWLGENLPAGFFNLDGKLPKVRSNIQLHKGWVQDTIEPYIAKNNVESIALLHIDTDTYTPAIYLLKTLKPYLKKGSILVFDELIGYPNWQQNEYKALNEVYKSDEYEFIAFTSRRAALRML